MLESLSWWEEVGVDGAVDADEVEVGLFAFVTRGPDDLIDDVAGIAGTELLAKRAVNVVDQVIYRREVCVDAVFARDAAHDFAELVVGDFPELDLGLDAAKECGVAKIGG